MFSKYSVARFFSAVVLLGLTLLCLDCGGAGSPPSSSTNNSAEGSNSGSAPANNTSSGTGSGATQAPAPPPPPPKTLNTAINHIVLLMQENRSFDEYFGQLNAYRASLGLSQEVDDLSQAGSISLPSWDGSGYISPFKMNTACVGDLSSSWVEAHIDISMHSPSNPPNPPPMNGFAYEAGGFAQHDPASGGFDVAGRRAMGYYDASQLPFYYWAATQFATSDHWFSAAPARTQINRMYFLAATSNGYAFPGGSDGHPELNMDGVKNIFELLEDAGITWRVYITDNYVSSKSLQSIGDTYMTYFSGFTGAHLQNFVNATQFATDAANGTLPQVALIESGYTETGQDEHPLNPIDKGARYAESLVKALINSPSWSDSVMFITYDEGGGFYDHVPPAPAVSPDGKKPYLLPSDPQGDFTITGFRVPLMVISPYAKANFVSHTPMDFTAFLKFIETRFSLPSLNARDAAQPDMTEFFDWTAPNANVTNIADQVALPCYFDHLP